MWVWCRHRCKDCGQKQNQLFVSVFGVIVHCCTRLSVGMSRDWVQGGNPQTWRCFLEQLPQSYLADFGQFFLQKAHATYIAEAEEQNWGPNIILTPSNRVVSKAGVTFPELRATFQN